MKLKINNMFLDENDVFPSTLSFASINYTFVPSFLSRKATWNPFLLLFLSIQTRMINFAPYHPSYAHHVTGKV